MGRRRWPGGEALFFPDCAFLHTCFTFLRPDLVFLDGRGRVVRLFHRARPWRFWGSFKARHCLEAPPGWVKRRGLSPGDRLAWKGSPWDRGQTI